MTDDIPETGAVFTFGKSHFADNEPSHFFIKNDPIVAISCGDEHSAVICQNGRVFVFGANTWGQLGLGHKEVVTRPSCVKWLKPQRAMFVACGRAHTVFVTDTNAIHTVGCNDEGQLGTGDLEHHTVPQYVELDLPATIKQVSAGSDHTAILTARSLEFLSDMAIGSPSITLWDGKDSAKCCCPSGTSAYPFREIRQEGRVYMCGSNSEGQLGLGEDTRSAVKFTELRFMETIAFVECGYYHTVFITGKGAVFVTGDNENQKLGLPNTATTIYVPQLLPIDTAIKSACCGASHTFLLSMDETKILAFGSNEKGQLGMPRDIDYVTEPKEIDMEKMFDGFQLKLVACGAMHTAFVTDNGLLYTCGESRHNKLCLEDIDTANSHDVVPNQYTPKRVTAMNGHIVDNVACGGCHTLLTATKGSNADFTNNDFNIVNETTRQIVLTELPPLKVPAMNKPEEPYTTEDVINFNAEGLHKTEPDQLNGNTNEETGSIDSLEANVSGSHIVNINDLENENGSTHDVADINKDEIDRPSRMSHIETMDVIESMDTVLDAAHDNIQNKVKEVTTETKDKIDDTVKNVTDVAKDKIEVVEEFVKKSVTLTPGKHEDAKKILSLPEKIDDIANSPPPKTPILPELLHIPDLSQISPVLSKHSDEKSETGQSENETIPCGSDKSSPQAGKTAKTQAVMPIVRSDDHIDMQVDAEHPEDSDVVVNKLQEKGRFARLFQSIRDKENSCMGKGKVIEENIVETVHDGVDNAEKSVHKVEETIETEIRNQTNSRTCTIL